MVRPITSEDYDTLVSWWKGHGWEVTPVSCLPPDGFIIEGVCAGWLYLTNSSLALFGWPVGNPDANPKEIREGMKLILEETKCCMRACDRKVMMAFTNRLGLENIYREHGFQVGDELITNYIYGDG